MRRKPMFYILNVSDAVLYLTLGNTCRIWQVNKSGHTPARVSRFNHTFFRGSNLQTVAGEQPVVQPANLSR